MRNLVVLIVGQRNVVLGPDDRRQWIRLDVTLQIHVVLQGLAESWTGNTDERLEFDGQIDVATVALAHTVVGHAVVSSAILFAHIVDLEHFSDVRRTA